MMGQSAKDPFGMGNLMEAWSQSMASVMETMHQDTGPDASGQEGPRSREGRGNWSSAQAAQWWKEIAGEAGSPENLAAILKGAGAGPELFIQFISTAMGNALDIFQEMNQAASRMDKTGAGSPFWQADSEPFKAWHSLYETELQKFFNLPQMGLAREYQERAGRMMDQLHQFQASYSEFAGLLSRPFKISMEKIHEKILSLSESGHIPDDPEEYYRIWITLLEEQFSQLLNSPEYLKALSGTMAALSRFSSAKDAVLEDLMKELPIAPRSEVDALAREVYELKHRVSQLEKRTDPPPVSGGKSGIN